MFISMQWGFACFKVRRFVSTVMTGTLFKMVKPSTRCATQRKHGAVAVISRHMGRAARATAGLVFIVSVLSGCAAISTPAPVDPQLQFVVEQRNANARYAQSVLAYKPMFENPGSYSRTQILEAYEAVLQQYSAAAGSWVRVVYPEARQALPPALRPLPPLSGPATLAVVNRDYESVLGMNAAMWEINLAASWGGHRSCRYRSTTAHFLSCRQRHLCLPCRMCAIQSLRGWSP